MPIHTLLLFGTEAVFLPVPAYRNLGLLIHVQIVTVITSGALLLDPMHANQLFPFDFVDMVGERRTDGCELIDARNVGRGDARLFKITVHYDLINNTQ